MNKTGAASRRTVLKFLGGSVALSVLIGACSSAPAVSPTTAPSAPTVGPTTAPAAPTTAPAAAPTQASAPTTAPTAAAAAAAPTGEKVPLKVWAWTKGEVDDAVKLFQAANPNIDVQYEVFSPQDSFQQKLDASYAGGSPPDVHRQNDDSIPDYGKKGILLPLESELPKVINKDDVYWEAIQACNTYGHLQAIPVAIRTGVLYYNVDLFKKYNVPLPPKEYPSDGWTWDKVLESCSALRQGDVWGFALATTNYDWFFDNVKVNGGDVMSKDCMKFTMNDPAAVDAIQYWADAINVKKVVAPDPIIKALGGETQMFAAQKTAMVSGSSIPLQGKLDFTWDIAGRPIVSGKHPSTFLAIQTWAAAKATKYPSQSISLLAFFVGESAQKTFAKTGAVIPINKKVSETDYVNDFPKANMKIPLQAAPYGSTMPMAIGTADVKALVRPEIQLVQLGKKSAKDAMNEIAPKANQALQKAGGC